MPRQINTWWDDLDRDASEEGIAFAKGYLQKDFRWDIDPHAHSVQCLGVYFDTWMQSKKE